MLAVLPASAQRKPVRHYLSLGIGAGEANTILSSPTYENLKNLAGADAQFEFKYEVRRRNFLFNIGIGAQYTYTGQNISEFIDLLPAIDHDGEAYTHRYVYNDYTERQHTMLIDVPLQLGFYMGNKAYMAFGVKAAFPALHTYGTHTLLHTDGLYPASYYWRDPLSDNPRYGFYPEDELGRGGNYHAGSSVVLSPTFEVGWFHYLTRNKKVCMRLGVYAEYACPLAQARHYPLTDYSSVNQMYQTKNPALFSKDDLWTNLRLNSILDGPELKRDWARLSVGVKATFLFQLKKKHRCFTCDDDSGLDYIGPRWKGGTTMMKDPFRK